MREFPILILAGYSGVGKSTIAPVLCERYGFHYINHQKLLHSLAEAKGYKRSRYWLAEVGTQSFIENSLTEMVNVIKREKESAKGFLIDAAYGDQMVEILKKSFPDGEVIVISVLASPETREQRIMGRMGAERESATVEMQFRDNFLVGAGLERLLKNPDFEVNNMGELAKTVEKISEFLSLKKIGPI